MAKKSRDPKQYINETSIDGKALEPGQVLVPTWLQEGYKIPNEAKQHIRTWRYGEFRFQIGFMRLQEEDFDAYMESFNEEINTYMAERREGRCVIGHKANGEPIRCPKSRLCTGCPEKYSHERYNPLKDRWQTLSLDFCFEDEDFDYKDENAVDPEAYVCSQEDESYEDLTKRIVAYFEATNPRYAQVIKLELQNIPTDEIIITLKLKSSRGHQIIREANNALCNLLQRPDMKK